MYNLCIYLFLLIYIIYVAYCARVNFLFIKNVENVQHDL